MDHFYILMQETSALVGRSLKYAVKRSAVKHQGSTTAHEIRPGASKTEPCGLQTRR